MSKQDKVQEYIDELTTEYTFQTVGANVGEDEQKKFISFLCEVQTRSNEGVIKPLFRGETRRRLAVRLRCNPEASMKDIATGLFAVGDKGKHFWKAAMRSRLEETDHSWPKAISDINDLSPDAFRGLVNILRGILVRDSLPVHQFKSTNPAFSNIITNREKACGLISMYSTLSDAEKRKVRDLFLYIVHNYSSHYKKTYTPFVSTTSDLNSAKTYANQNIEAEDNPCVICLFLSKRHERQVIQSDSLDGPSDILLKKGFAGISKPIFSKEEEVAFLGAIYPEFVYAIINLNEKAIYCNPLILKVSHDAKDDVWVRGLPVDRDGFEDDVRDNTGYTGWVEYNDYGESEFKV